MTTLNVTVEVAHNAAMLLVREAINDRPHSKRPIYLSVMTRDRKTVPDVRYDWQDMNLFGVSFPRDASSLARATAWCVDAMLAGYVPFIQHRKRGFGYQPTAVLDILHP